MNRYLYPFVTDIGFSSTFLKYSIGNIMKSRDYDKGRDYIVNLSKDSQRLVLLKLLDYAFIEPKSLNILKSLFPQPKEYFKPEELSQTMDNSTVKQNILNIVKKHFYSVTKNNQDNLINILQYLFSDNKLNIKDFLLDNFISFNKILVNLFATGGKGKLIEYLLEHKTNEEFTFKDALTEKTIKYEGNNYSLYDIFSENFPKKLQQNLKTIQKSTLDNGCKPSVQRYYQNEVTEYLAKLKGACIFENKFIELFYTLFDFSNQNNVKLFLNKFSDLFKNINRNDDQKVCQFNSINNVFNQSFLYNCDISERITFFAFRCSLDKEDKDCVLSLKIQKDIQILINHKIIGAKDFALQKEATKFLFYQTNEGIENTYNILSENADKIKDGSIILAKILVNYTTLPINKVQVYNKLSANLLNTTGKYNFELIDSYTKNAISLIEENIGELNTEQIEQQNNVTINAIRNAYWNRGSYYTKFGNNIEAIKYHLQYLKLINKRDIWDHIEDIKMIINNFNNHPEFSTEIDQIFNILSTKQEDENLNQTLDQRRELFNNIIKSKITRNNVQEHLEQINKLQSSNTIKSVALEVCKNILVSLVAQDEQKLTIVFSTSYLNLSYEEGRKHFSLDAQDSTDLVQAVIFFIKHQKFQVAAEYLCKAETRYESMKQTFSKLNTAFSNLHLELALNFIAQDIKSHKSIIEKHLALAEKLSPDLDIQSYYLVFNILLGEINEEQIEKQIQQNPEIQDLVDEEIKECVADNKNLHQSSNLPTVSEPVDKVAIYQKAAHKFYQEQKRKLDNHFNLNKQDYFSWKVGDKVYSTKNSEIADLGYGKYCIIDDKLKGLQQYEFYKKAMEKGYVNKSFDQNGIKHVGSTYEVKICTQDGRLHNNNVCYINPEGKKLIIFVKQANHSDIKELFSTSVKNIMVDSDYLSEHQEDNKPQQSLDIYPDYDPNDFNVDCLGEEEGN
ncbi:hypothetical protein [Candidatus Tisiphia endosymbiont of Hybos culiciformis]|uniref:hypothetical protein n=1 Tax=Candidatus Tisiphia endosymbiont of Hybos culiciformis TaxID=3139331 RepID=UPI003CCB37D6